MRVLHDIIINIVSRLVYQDHSSYGLFRYNKFVDTANEIKLKDNLGKEELLARLDALPYDGSGKYSRY